MSACDIAVTRLQSEEGFRALSYTDTTGHQTIGYGFNVTAGISKNAARALLLAQIQDISAVLSGYAWFQRLDDVRSAVLIDLAFNLGVNGLLHFPKMLAAIAARDWVTAHDELMNSDAAKLLPNRYGALATTLLNGA